jgi:IMP dehydrogenase/GMP reductase
VFKQSFTFGDILIQPSTFSRIKSRSYVDTSINLGNFKLKIPVISASMSLFDTISPYEAHPYRMFARKIAEAGGIHIFSRALSFSDRVFSVHALNHENLNVGMAVGLDEFFAKKSELEKLNAIISIDIANGSIIPEIVWGGDNPLIVGNFANPDISMVKRFNGNIILKLGVGSGAACSTRVTTGVGFPQAGLIYEAAKNSNYKIISDGGVGSVSDFTKALALGADFVMTGRMFGHVKETPWEVLEINGKKYKPYRGMASKEEKKSKKFVEGASGYIEFTDRTVQEIMYDLSDGLRSAMSYCDALNLNEFSRNANFVQAPSHREESSVRLINV